MDVWTYKSRPALFAALEEVCDAIGEDLKSTIEVREKHKHAALQDELENLRRVAENTERLERENRNLRQELAELREKHRQVLSPARKDAHPSRPPLADVSPNEAAGRLVDNLGHAPHPASEEKDWKRECAKITNKYTVLNERYEKLAHKAREFRDDKDGWLRYAEVLEKKLEKLEKKLQEKDGISVKSAAAQFQGATSDGELNERTACNASFISNLESDPRVGRTGNSDSEGDSRLRRATSMPAIDTSQHQDRAGVDNTDDLEESDELPPIPPSLRNEQVVKIKEEPSSDEPIVVSERNLQKRKHTGGDTEMPPPPRRIKIEPHTSSDPVVTAEATAFSPHESIDLDDDQIDMPTPRKQRPSWMRTLREEEVTPGSPTDRVTRSLFPRPLIDTPPITPTTLDRAIGTRPTASRPSRPEVVKTSKDREWALGVGVADLAEDAAISPGIPESPQATTISRAPSSSTVGRLQTLLNPLTPQPDLTPLRPTRPGLQAAGLDSEVAESPLDTRGRPKPSAKIADQPTPAPRQQGGSDGSSKQTPGRLRTTHLSKLKASDFKVNPKFNNGYTFAFDDVVRNKAERAELSGCTDYNCCGRHYRALAESELSATGIAALSRVADIKMMEGFLGGGAYKLVDMTQEERKEVWIKAKAQDMANRLGKHRHRFARQASPPGYWNPDFPTTQEMEENKEESARRERKQVEERWREAMKPGRSGKWLFRDE